MTKKCLNWLDNNTYKNPRLVFDLGKLKENYSIYKKNFEEIIPYYAIKANPNKKIIITLNDLGCHFDCASL